MIIGISGKIGSGKDTVGKIIQYLTSSDREISIQNLIKILDTTGFLHISGNSSSWEVKKFADKLKDIVCLLLGCTREQLEDHEFKNTELGEEWTTYAYADGHNDHYRNGEWTKTMNSVPCSKERYEEEKRINWQTAYKRTMTPRLLLQLIGTKCGRNIIHPNVWVNSLMSEYKCLATKRIDIMDFSKNPQETIKGKEFQVEDNLLGQYPNWIITDMRFPNELQAVKERKDISIRVERPYQKGTKVKIVLDNSIEEIVKYTEAVDGKSKYQYYTDNSLGFWREYDLTLIDEHPSETALDDAEFDYTIENKGTIEELIEKVKEILIKEKIINN